MRITPRLRNRGTINSRLERTHTFRTRSLRLCMVWIILFGGSGRCPRVVEPRGFLLVLLERLMSWLGAERVGEIGKVECTWFAATWFGVWLRFCREPCRLGRRVWRARLIRMSRGRIRTAGSRRRTPRWRLRRSLRRGFVRNVLHARRFRRVEVEVEVRQIIAGRSGARLRSGLSVWRFCAWLSVRSRCICVIGSTRRLRALCVGTRLARRRLAHSGVGVCSWNRFSGLRRWVGELLLEFGEYVLFLCHVLFRVVNDPLRDCVLLGGFADTEECHALNT